MVFFRIFMSILLVCLLDFLHNSTSAENLCVGSVLESSCTSVGTKVLRSDPPSTFLTEASYARSLLSHALASSHSSTLKHKPKKLGILPFTITVSPGTFLPDQLAIGSTVHAIYQVTNNNSITATNATFVSLPPNASINSTGCGAASSFTLAPGASCTLTLTLSPTGLAAGQIIDGSKAPHVLMACWNDGISCAGTSNPLHVSIIAAPSATYQELLEDKLTNADLWGSEPEILSANYGFEGIEGVPQGQSYVIAAGGAWENITTSGASYSAYTSAATPSDVSFDFGYETSYADAMPICFSWPVLPSTVNPSDFLLTLNTGQTVQPQVASISPNFLYNKRSCVVIFGSFGNRLAPGTAGAVYPTNLTIIDKGTTLKLVGPGGTLSSAVGLTKSCGNPYQTGGGPTLIGAKLSVINPDTTPEEDGQWAPASFRENLPNGGKALYGTDAQYRLRIYTTAGISPDGVAAILPTDFSRFFQVEVTDHDGSKTQLTQTGVPYTFGDGTITVVGLADLGKAGTAENDAYVADRDNYLDIILKGDEAAMRLITAVIIPASGDDYSPLYNPGGPGNNPTPGVTYTSPGPYTYQLVTMAIDDPQTVNYPTLSTHARH